MGLTQSEMYQSTPESVIAQEHITAHYPSGASDPATLITPTADTEKTIHEAEATDGVASAEVVATTPDGRLTEISAVLTHAPDSDVAKQTITDLRANTDALVGGSTAQILDTQQASDRDLKVVIPAVLLVVLAVLIRVFNSRWVGLGIRGVRGLRVGSGRVVRGCATRTGARSLM
ncbi:MMPL family transporter [Streptomyces fractus]|uniref:MMPL family transporter n=1 Tax=Streptomyces fractus TaxID=641806 RepID=UPI003CFA5F02